MNMSRVRERRFRTAGIPPLVTLAALCGLSGAAACSGEQQGEPTDRGPDTSPAVHVNDSTTEPEVEGIRGFKKTAERFSMPSWIGVDAWIGLRFGMDRDDVVYALSKQGITTRGGISYGDKGQKFYRSDRFELPDGVSVWTQFDDWSRLFRLEISGESEKVMSHMLEMETDLRARYSALPSSEIDVSRTWSDHWLDIRAVFSVQTSEWGTRTRERWSMKTRVDADDSPQQRLPAIAGKSSIRRLTWGLGAQRAFSILERAGFSKPKLATYHEKKSIVSIVKSCCAPSWPPDVEEWYSTRSGNCEFRMKFVKDTLQEEVEATCDFPASGGGNHVASPLKEIEREIGIAHYYTEITWSMLFEGDEANTRMWMVLPRRRSKDEPWRDGQYVLRLEVQ